MSGLGDICLQINAVPIYLDKQVLNEPAHLLDEVATQPVKYLTADESENLRL